MKTELNRIEDKLDEILNIIKNNNTPSPESVDSPRTGNIYDEEDETRL